MDVSNNWDWVIYTRAGRRYSSFLLAGVFTVEGGFTETPVTAT